VFDSKLCHFLIYKLKIMKNLLLVIFLFFTKSIYAQINKSLYLKLDNGITMSSFRSNPNLQILEDINVNYSTSLGIDFQQTKWFYFSSQVGYVRIGGNETNKGLIGTSNYKISENSDYIHLNTTFRVATKRPGLNAFVGVGPYANFLMSSKKLQADLYKEGYEFQSFHFGGKTEIGFTQDLKKFRFGLIGSYMFNLSPVITNSDLTLKNETFSTILSLGYTIK
jgi:hypothetical protein